MPSDIKGDVGRGWRKRLAPMRRFAESVGLFLAPVRWRTPAEALARVRKLRLHRNLRELSHEGAGHHGGVALRVLRQAGGDVIEHFKSTSRLR